MRPVRTLVVVLLVALASGLVEPSRASARMLMTVELGPGVSIPLARYIDSEGEEGFNRVENGVHAAFNLSVIFGSGWTFRYGVSWLSLGRYSYRLPDDVFAATQEVYQYLGIGDDLHQAGEGQADDALQFHSLTFGYRFHLLRGRWQPYIPIEIGAAIVQSDYLSRTLYGFAASTGIGLDVRIWRFLYLGLDVRYNFYLTETDTSIALSGLATSKNIFESVVAMAHVLGVTFNVQARY